MKRSAFSGEQLAQVRNPDPFAAPVWRSPVYRTPGWIIAAAQLARLAWRLVRFTARHPAATAVAAGLAAMWVYTGWPGLVGLVGGLTVGLAAWRWLRPGSFTRFVMVPARARRRAWHYRRRWAAVMIIAKLAVSYQGRVLLPALGKVTSTGYTDRVIVALVSGQSPAEVADRADNLAHGFGALLCRVRSARPGMVVLELVRRDALAAIIPALPDPCTL